MLYIILLRIPIEEYFHNYIVNEKLLIFTAMIDTAIKLCDQLISDEFSKGCLTTD